MDTTSAVLVRVTAANAPMDERVTGTAAPGSTDLLRLVARVGAVAYAFAAECDAEAAVVLRDHRAGELALYRVR